jgi:hypothetical protein
MPLASRSLYRVVRLVPVAAAVFALKFGLAVPGRAGRRCELDRETALRIGASELLPVREGYSQCV